MYFYFQANILREHRPAGRGMFAVACHSWRCSSHARKFPPLCTTKGNAISLGTNFLAFGHLPMIRHSIIVEFPRRSDDKFPDLPEMLVLLMYRIAEKLCPRLCRRLVSMYSTVQSLYNEHAAREVRLLSLHSCLVTKLQFSIFNHLHFGSNRRSSSSSKSSVK